MSDNDRLTPLDPIDDSDLRGIDAMLTAAGRPWRQMQMPDEGAQQLLASLAARESAARSDGIPPARISMPSISHAHIYGGRVMTRPSRITAFLAVALTICLIAASVGIFVILNQHHPGGPVTNKITPTPTPHGPLMMPRISDLVMVSDHEGWAIQTQTSDDVRNLLHFYNGVWHTVTLAGMSSAYSATLAMTSASDGWLLASVQDPATQIVHQFLYHYDGTAWNQAAMPTLHGAGMPVITTISLGANGDGWMAGEFINSGAKILSEQQLIHDGALSCLPNCGSSLLLHLVGGRWTQVTVPASINITPESVSVGWFVGGTADPKALYHYQNGTWSRVPLDIATLPTTIAMLSPTDGWIGTVSQPTGNTISSNSWIIYHFDGTTVRQAAQTTYQHCLGGITPSLSAVSPADAWVPLIVDSAASSCMITQRLMHIQGETSTTVPLPPPYNYVNSTAQHDAEGNTWLLTSQIDSQGIRQSPDLTHEAILRWNGSQWTIFAQSQG